MATHCKIIYGYTDHTGWWIETSAYYRHYDGYTEAIIPLLKKTGADIVAMNLECENEGHKFEKLENSFDYGRTDYIYYIDCSNRNKIKCTVLESDLDFSIKYDVDNYKVLMELIL